MCDQECWDDRCHHEERSSESFRVNPQVPALIKREYEISRAPDIEELYGCTGPACTFHKSERSDNGQDARDKISISCGNRECSR
jgi:hypothetical protein